MNKKELLDAIDQVSFAMDDVRLYLDTHPQCQYGLDYFQQLNHKRKELISQYTINYGPLTQYDINSESDLWTWNQGPLPWEVGGCR